MHPATDSLDYTVRLLQTVGFPAFVALWFMFRTDKRLDDLTAKVSSALDRLREGK